MNFTELTEQLSNASGSINTYPINESSIRNISAVALVAKVSALDRSIKSINMSKTEKVADLHIKTLRVNKLLSKQHLWMAVLVAQLGIMNKEDKR